MSSVTVAISTYEGHSPYLDYCIESALTADEVLVLDNGGSCESIAADYDVVYRVTSGLVESRSTAIEMASCDYLVHLDADDWLSTIPACEGDWCYGDLKVYNGGWTMWDYSTFPREKVSARAYLEEHRSLPVPMKAAFRVAWLRDNGLSFYGWPGIELFGEDVWTCLTYLEHSPDIRYIDPFYCYRMTEKQGSQDTTKRAEWMSLLDAYLKGDA